MGRKYRDTKQFIIDAIAVHGDRYLYDKSIFKGLDYKVVIGCKIHGDFDQAADSHLVGKGCKKCASEKRSASMTITEDEYVTSLYKRYGMQIICSDYKGKSKVGCFTCSVHGEFKTNATTVLNSPYGCSKCKVSAVAVKQKGKVIKKSGKLYGVALNDWHDVTRGNPEISPVYRVWSSMIARCYSSCKNTRKVGTTVSPRWLIFSNFAEDLQTMVGYEKVFTREYKLDKDFLSTGNKHYSKETCVLIPTELNSNYHEKIKQSTGVWLTREGRYGCCMSVGNKTTHFGTYDTYEEAFDVRKKHKIQRMKYLANKWKGKVDNRVILVLENYTY